MPPASEAGPSGHRGMTILPSTSLVDAMSQGEPTSTPYASQTFQWGKNMNGDPSPPTSGSFYLPAMPTNDATNPQSTSEVSLRLVPARVCLPDSEDTRLNSDVSLQRAPASSNAAYLPTMVHSERVSVPSTSQEMYVDISMEERHREGAL